MTKETEYTPPEKGKTALLNVTKNAKHRILVGLSWDENKKDGNAAYFRSQLTDSLWIIIRNPRSLSYFIKKPEALFEKIDGQRREQDDPNFDLDLSCFAFDKDGNFKDFVDPNAYNAIDDSSKFYHSGEDMDGSGDLDDEQIYIELKDIEKHYEHFFIVVDSDCMHRLNQVNNVRIRLADSMTNNTLLEANLNELENNNNYSFIFCHVFYKDDAWHLKNISAFVDDNQNWPETLKKMILRT